jgi:Cu(I)/Ag(I) efflux system membrane fusion protein
MLSEGEGKFRPVNVETGAQGGGQTEIRSGLSVGQKIVVSGQFLIDSEASLKATEARLQ